MTIYTGELNKLFQYVIRSSRIAFANQVQNFILLLFTVILTINGGHTVKGRRRQT